MITTSPTYSSSRHYIGNSNSPGPAFTKESNFLKLFLGELKTCCLQAYDASCADDVNPVYERVMLKLLIPLFRELKGFTLLIENLKICIEIPAKFGGNKILFRVSAHSVLLDDISNTSNENYQLLLDGGCQAGDILGKSFRVRGFSSSIEKTNVAYDSSQYRIVPNFINPFFLDMSCYVDNSPPTAEKPLRVRASASIDNLEFTPYISCLYLFQEVIDFLQYANATYHEKGVRHSYVSYTLRRLVKEVSRVYTKEISNFRIDKVKLAMRREYIQLYTSLFSGIVDTKNTTSSSALYKRFSMTSVKEDEESERQLARLLEILSSFNFMDLATFNFIAESTLIRDKGWTSSEIIDAKDQLYDMLHVSMKAKISGSRFEKNCLDVLYDTFGYYKHVYCNSSRNDSSHNISFHFELYVPRLSLLAMDNEAHGKPPIVSTVYGCHITSSTVVSEVQVELEDALEEDDDSDKALHRLNSLPQREFYGKLQLNHVNEGSCRLGTIKVMVDDFSFCEATDSARFWENMETAWLSVSPSKLSSSHFVYILDFRKTKLCNIGFGGSSYINYSAHNFQNFVNRGDLFLAIDLSHFSLRLDESRLKKFSDAIDHFRDRSGIKRLEQVVSQCAYVSTSKYYKHNPEQRSHTDIKINVRQFAISFSLEGMATSPRASSSSNSDHKFVRLYIDLLSYKLSALIHRDVFNKDELLINDDVALSNLSTRSLWDNMSFIIPSIVRSMRDKSFSLNPVVCEISGLQIEICNADSSRQLFQDPLGIKSVLSIPIPFLVSSDWHRQRYIDLFASQLHIHLTITDIDVFLFCASKFTGFKSNDKIRINSLAPLQLYLMHINFDCLQVSIRNDEEIESIVNNVECTKSSSREIIRQSLVSFESQVTRTDIGNAKIQSVIASMKSSIIEQLQFLGIPVGSAESLMKSYHDEIVSKRVAKSLSLEIAMTRAEKFIKNMFRSRPMIHLKVEGAHSVFYTLTYDYRIEINVEEIRIFDYFGNAVVHFYTPPPSPSEFRSFSASGLFTPSIRLYNHSTIVAASPSTSSSADDPQRVSGAPGVKDSVQNMKDRLNEDASVSSFCALRITLAVQDKNSPWGQGGFPIECIYDVEILHDGNAIDSREGNLSLKIERIVSSICPTSLLPTVEMGVGIANVIQPYMENTCLSKNLELSIQSQTKHQEVFIIGEKKGFLSHMEFSGAEIIVSNFVNSATKIPLFLFSLNTLCIVDLISTYDHHPFVLALDDELEHMMKIQSLQCLQQPSEIVKIIAHLNSCDFCLEVTFIESLLGFLDSFNQLIISSWNTFPSTMDSTTKQPSSTVSKEPEKIWSYVSSVTVEFNQLTCRLPQHFSSKDYLGMKLEYSHITCHRYHKAWSAPPQHWKAPSGSELGTFKDPMIHFDLESFEWVQTLGSSDLPPRKGYDEQVGVDSIHTFPRVVGRLFHIDLYTVINEECQHLTQDIVNDAMQTLPFSKLFVLELPLFCDPRTNPAYDYNTRLLVSDITEVTNQENAIHLDLSFAQNILILDVFYNISESFSIFDGGTKHGGGGDGDIDADMDDGGGMFSFEKDTMKYGSQQYCAYLVNQVTHFEVVMAVHVWDLKMSIEASQKNIFTSLQAPEDTPMDAMIPLAVVKTTNAVFHFKVGGDVIRMAMGFGGFNLADIRQPARSIPQLCDLIRAQYSQSSVRYSSYADFSYGLTLSPSLETLETPCDLPFQLSSFACSSSKWNTSNVGIGWIDANIKTQHIFRTISEYFCHYYYKPNIGVSRPYSRAFLGRSDKTIVNYSAFDYRIFLFKPNVCVAKNPMLLESETLMVETDNGIFCRLTLDSNMSYRIETQLNSLAIVIFKKRQEGLRGLRGISGSGRGVRTAVEFLCCSFAYHYDAVSNSIDMIINLHPSSLRPTDVTQHDEDGSAYDDNFFCQDETHHSDRDEDKSPSVKRISTAYTGQKGNDQPKYINLDAEFIEFTTISWMDAKCVYPLETPCTRSSKSSCDIVTSCDDFFFIFQCLIDFFGDLTFLKTLESAFDAGQNEQEDSVSLYLIARLECVKLVLVDDVLGLHQPLLQLFFDLGEFTLSKSSSSSDYETQPFVKSSRRLFWSTKVKNDLDDEVVDEAASDFMMFSKLVFSADYFNNFLKCWEPCSGPCSTQLFIERNADRGIGLYIKSLSPLYLTLTSAFFVSINNILSVVDKNLSGDIVTQLVTGSTINPVHSDVPGDLKLSVSDIDEVLVEDVIEGLEGNRRSSFQRQSLALGSPQRPVELRRSDKAYGDNEENHVLAQILDHDEKVGFSLKNITGQSIRYIQAQSHSYNKEINYLVDGESGYLNFAASEKVIRNFDVVEEAFNVQREITDIKSNTQLKRHAKTRSLHQISMQICGFQWLPFVQADNVCVTFHELKRLKTGDDNHNGDGSSISSGNSGSDSGGGGGHRKSITPVDPKIRNALKLITEVIPMNGGRSIIARSVFTIVNLTGHTVSLFMSPSKSTVVIATDSISIKPGEKFHLPIALMTHSHHIETEPALGFLWFSPESVDTIKSEFESTTVNGKLAADDRLYVDFTHNPLDICDVISEQQNSNGNDSRKKILKTCKISVRDSDSVRENNSLLNMTQRLPAFCYYLDVDPVNDHNRKKIEKKKKKGVKQKVMDTIVNVKDTFENYMAQNQQEEKGKNRIFSPTEYIISLHPPFLLENLLPVEALFQLVRKKTQDKEPALLWTGKLGAGKAKAIHTVSLDSSIILTISLSYMSSDAGIVVHQLNEDSEVDRFDAAALLLAAATGLDSKQDIRTDQSIFMTDSVGQKIRLMVENKSVGSGQRHITVYAPYWIVNTSHHTLLLREINHHALPAGTITPPMNGESGMDGSAVLYDLQNYFRLNSDMVYPGKPGAVQAVIDHCGLGENIEDLPFDTIRRFAYIYSFREESSNIGDKCKVQFKLQDGGSGSSRDQTNWSDFYSLNSMGVNQTVICDSFTKGHIEVGLKITSAPGRLSNYTKIVILSPRYVVVNRLFKPIKVIQSLGFGREATPIEIPARNCGVFDMLEYFKDPKVCFDIEDTWDKTCPVLMNKVGTEMLRIERKFELKNVPHITTRGKSQYDLELPYPDIVRELGIQFETDWGQTQILVKKVVTGKWATDRSDVQVGDVLLAIDGVSMIGEDYFDRAMGLIKDRPKNSYVPNSYKMTLTFRTAEEKLKLIREGRGLALDEGIADIENDDANAEPQALDHENYVDGDYIGHLAYGERTIVRIDIQSISSSTYSIVDTVSDEKGSEYMVKNESACYVLQLRQKGIYGNKWITMPPQTELYYVWDDPFKRQKRLLLRVIDNVVSPNDNEGRIVDTIEAITVDFEKINHFESIKLYGPEGKKMIVRVDADKTTRVMRFCHESPPESNQVNEMKVHQEVAFTSLSIETQTRVLRDFLHSPFFDIPIDGDYTSAQFKGQFYEQAVHDTLKLIQEPLQNYANQLGGDHVKNLDSYSCPDTLVGKEIYWLNRLNVDVIKGKSLRPSAVGRFDDVYCKIRLQDKKMTFSNLTNPNVLMTSTCERTLNPEWFRERLVFKTPPEATASEGDGYFLHVIVMGKRLLGDMILGETTVKLSYFKDEEAVIGWFSLQLKSVSTAAEIADPLAAGLAQSAGSIKLKVQWIHSPSVFQDHLREAVLNRINDLMALKYSLDENSLKNLQSNKQRPTLLKRGSSANAASYNAADFEDNEGSDGTPGCPAHSPQSVRDSDRKDLDSVETNQVPRLASPPLFLQTPISSGKYKGLIRRTWIKDSNSTFAGAFQHQCSNAYRSTAACKGLLFVSAISACHVPQHKSKHPVYVKVCYGNQSKCTNSSGGKMLGLGSDVAWKTKGRGRNSYSSESSDLSDREYMKFKIDSINSQGFIRVSIMTESFPNHEELCRVNIPILGIIECAAPVYSAHFPLVLNCDVRARDGDLDNYAGKVPTTEIAPDDFLKNDHTTPYIYLVLRYKDNNESSNETDSAIAVQNSPRADVNLSFFHIATSSWLRMSVPSASLAMVNSSKRMEVVAATINDCDVRQISTDKISNTTLTISVVQFDNQLKDTFYPVICCPTKCLMPRPFITLHTSKDLMNTKANLIAYKIISLIIQEMDLNLTQSSFKEFADMLHDWVNASKDNVVNVVNTENRQYDTIENLGFASTLKEASDAVIINQPFRDQFQNFKNSKYYITQMEINPVKVNLSLIVNDGVDVTEDVSSLGDTLNISSDMDLLLAINSFIWQIGEIVAELNQDVHNHVVKINALSTDNWFLNKEKIGSIFDAHYLRTMIVEMHRATGAIDVDIIGNSAVGLVSSLGVGVKDLFFEPSNAVISNSGNVGSSVVKGAVSLVTSTTDGMIGTATKMTRGVGKFMTSLSADVSFKVQRQKLQKLPQSFAGAVNRPVKDMYYGVVFGITGLVREPLNSLKKYGTMQSLVVGMGRGALGLVGKPIVGVLDASTHVGDSIRETVRKAALKYETQNRRRKCKNPVGPDQRLLPYEHSVVTGHNYLSACDAYLSRLDEAGDIPFLSVFTQNCRKYGAIGTEKSKRGKLATEAENEDDLYDASYSRERVIMDETLIDDDPEISNRRNSLERRNSSSWATKEHQFDTIDEENMEKATEVVLAKFVYDQDDQREEEKVIIVSTRRFIYMRCKRGNHIDHDIIIDLWLCDIDKIDTLEYSGEKLSMSSKNLMQNKHNKGERERLKSFTYDNNHPKDKLECKLEKLYCILLAMKQRIQILGESGSHFLSEYWDDQYEVFHIGPWQFSEEQVEDLNSQILVYEWREPGWSNSSQASWMRGMPRWRIEFSEQCRRSHEQDEILNHPPTMIEGLDQVLSSGRKSLEENIKRIKAIRRSSDASPISWNTTFGEDEPLVFQNCEQDASQAAASSLTSSYQNRVSQLRQSLSSTTSRSFSARESSSSVAQQKSARHASLRLSHSSSFDASEDPSSRAEGGGRPHSVSMTYENNSSVSSISTIISAGGGGNTDQQSCHTQEGGGLPVSSKQTTTSSHHETTSKFSTGTFSLFRRVTYTEDPLVMKSHTGGSSGNNDYNLEKKSHEEELQDTPEQREKDRLAQKEEDQVEQELRREEEKEWRKETNDEVGGNVKYTNNNNNNNSFNAFFEVPSKIQTPVEVTIPIVSPNRRRLSMSAGKWQEIDNDSDDEVSVGDGEEEKEEKGKEEQEVKEASVVEGSVGRDLGTVSNGDTASMLPFASPAPIVAEDKADHQHKEMSKNGASKRASKGAKQGGVPDKIVAATKDSANKFNKPYKVKEAKNNSGLPNRRASTVSNVSLSSSSSSKDLDDRYYIEKADIEAEPSVNPNINYTRGSTEKKKIKGRGSLTNFHSTTNNSTLVSGDSGTVTEQEKGGPIFTQPKHYS